MDALEVTVSFKGSGMEWKSDFPEHEKYMKKPPDSLLQQNVVEYHTCMGKHMLFTNMGNRFKLYKPLREHSYRVASTYLL